MKILAFHPTAELYGADRIFASCVGFLRDSGNQVDVILGNDGKLADLIQHKTEICPSVMRLPIAVRSRLGVWFLIDYIFRLISLISYAASNRKTYDVIYINTLSLAICAPIFRMVTASKIVVHSHEIIAGGVLTNRLIKLAVAFSHKVICVSRAVLSDMDRICDRADRAKFVVVYNGIPDGFSHIPRGPSSRELKGKIVMLLLGRLMPEKGHYFLLKALYSLPSEVRQKIHVKVVGSPPPARKYLVEEFKQLIETYRLEGVVFLSDFVDDPFHQIVECDVMLVPSLMKDPFPTTVLESMMHGKPVIATNHGGAREVIEAANSGLLIDPQNVEDFSEAIIRYVGDPGLMRAHGVNGRKFYLSDLAEYDFKDRFMRVFSFN